MFDTPTLTRRDDGEFDVSFGGDENCIVRFFDLQVYQDHKSKEAGEDVFDPVPQIEIKYAGDRNKVTVRPVLPDDMRRFPKEWAIYSGTEGVLGGTMIAGWPDVSAPDAMQLNAAGLLTVEQLAAVPDKDLDGLGLGARLFRDRARRYLARNVTPSGAKIGELTAENAGLKERLARIEDMIASGAFAGAAKPAKA